MSDDALIVRVRRLLDHGSRIESDALGFLFARERELAEAVALAALGQAALDDLIAAGLLRRTPDGYVGVVRLVRFEQALIASDRYGFRRHRGFVMGPASSSQLLAGAVKPSNQGRGLDLGCGPGTHALRLASWGMQALGIDINERALGFAAFNRRLNDADTATFARGDFLTAPPDSALDERFDVVVANPPFVLAPASSLTYRDRPLARDETSRVTIERVVRAMAPGGRGYVVCNWVGDDARDWDRAPKQWLKASGCRTAVSRVASLSAEQYAAIWNRDLIEPQRGEAIREWAATLAAEGTSHVHAGVLAIAKPRSAWIRRTRSISMAGPARPDWRRLEEVLAA